MNNEYIHYKLIRGITYIPQGTAFRPSDSLFSKGCTCVPQFCPSDPPILEGVKGGRMFPLVFL